MRPLRTRLFRTLDLGRGKRVDAVATRRVRLPAALVVAFCALGLFESPKEASAAGPSGWSPAKALGRNAESCHLDTLASGEVFATWQERRVVGSGRKRTYRYTAFVARRSRGGAWRTRQVWTYSDRNDGVRAGCPLVAPFPAGDADVIWTDGREVPGKRSLQSVPVVRRLSKSGALGKRRTLFRAGNPSQVTVNARGAALLVLDGGNRVAARSPAGRWDSPQRLKGDRHNVTPTIAMNDVGDAVIAWRRPGLSLYDPTMAATRRGLGRFTKVRVADSSSTACHNGEKVSASMDDSGEAALAFDCSGRATEAGTRKSVRVARSRSLADGTWRDSAEAVGVQEPRNRFPKVGDRAVDGETYTGTFDRFRPVGVSSTNGQVRVSYTYEHLVETTTYNAAAGKSTGRVVEDVKSFAETNQAFMGAAWSAPAPITVALPLSQGRYRPSSFADTAMITGVGNVALLVACRESSRCVSAGRESSGSWGRARSISVPGYRGVFALRGHIAAYMDAAVVRTARIP